MIILINNNDILSSPIAAITLWKRQKSETKMNAVTAMVGKADESGMLIRTLLYYTLHL